MHKRAIFHHEQPRIGKFLVAVATLSVTWLCAWECNLIYSIIVKNIFELIYEKI